jgi:hypothetical protein
MEISSLQNPLEEFQWGHNSIPKCDAALAKDIMEALLLRRSALKLISNATTRLVAARERFKQD